MNKYRNALRIVYTLAWGDPVSVKKWKETALVLEDMVKKQTPMEPIPTENDKYLCCKCSNIVLSSTKKETNSSKYCGTCGQAIDWGDIDE